MSILKSAAADIAETIAAAKQHQAMLRKYRREVNRVVAPVVAAHKAGVLRYTPSVSVHGRDADWWKATFNCHVSTVDLDGFKDKRLTGLLSKLIHADQTKTKDYPESLNRDFVMTFRISDTAEVVVTVCAYVRSDSPTCRKVLKSEKTEVVVKQEYEIVCS